MELNYIAEFVKITEMGGFQKAAEELNISQSSLSQHIKRLEDQLGFCLLDRSSRSVKLTIAGQHFPTYAYRFVSLSNDCDREMAEYRGAEKNTLRLGTRVLNRYNLTELISRYRFLYPHINVVIKEAGTADLKSMLLKNECDVIIIRQLEPAGEQFSSVLLQEDWAVLAVPANHRLAQTTEPVSLLDFQKETFISQGDLHILNMLTNKACKKAGFRPRIIDDKKDTHTILSMVECGMGVAIITKEMTDPSFKNVVYLEFSEAIPLHVYVLYQKNRRRSAPCRLFLQCLEEE